MVKRADNSYAFSQNDISLNTRNIILSNTLLALVVISKFALQYHLIADGFELHRDEYLHLDQARHLAWGFVSIPPATSFISWIIYLLGNSVFWVKFFPALFGTLTIVLVWKSVEALNGGIYARILAALGTMFSAYLRINTLYQPNSLDILSWAFLFFCVIKYISTKENKWIYWFAIGFGIGFLNKYNIFFLLAGLIPALLLTEHRKLFKQRALYIALGIGLIIIAPNIIWQFQNGLPVVSHMQELSSGHLIHVSRISIVLEQIMFFLPSILVLLFAFIGFIFYKPFKSYRAIVFSFLITLALFLYFKGKPYYALGLYPPLFAFGSVYLEYLTKKGLKRYFRPAMILIIIVLGIIYIPITCPVFSITEMQKNEQVKDFYRKTGQLKWEDGKEHDLPQDFADMVGWKELAGIVNSVWDTLTDEQKEKTIIFCENYGQAGATNYYGKEYMGAVSNHDDYKNWFPQKEIENVILILGKNRNVPEDYTKVFGSVSYIGRIENTASRENGTSVYLLSNPSRIVRSEELRD